ncbi:MAG: hypothetical protein WCS94_18665 [Verrucomicrobiota bacterium]
MPLKYKYVNIQEIPADQYALFRPRGAAPLTNATALVISEPMAMLEHDETRAATKLGATQEDTARELSAKLAGLKGIV